MTTKASASNKVKPITLNAYNERYKDDSVASLYVLNRTEPRGNVAFSAVNDLGQPIAVVVPATFIPIDLTTQATKESLMKSTHFRRALNQRQLVILDNDSAENFLRSNPLAKTELRNLSRIDGLIASDLKEIEGSDDLEEIDLGGGGGRKKTRHFEGDNISSNQFVNAFISRAAEDSQESDENLEREFLNKGLSLPVEELELLRKHITRPAIVELIVQALDEAEA
ncbi:hypothetical protein pEaSNUABM25_00226 [Erwinia phage pEa_SNUABM_25]|nr:hypothetical protein pEaSNUABM25_00226 [Erwinia phage pEa_SNUABM_25]